MKKVIEGKIWGGPEGECNKEQCVHRGPQYIIPEPDDYGFFLCDILKEFARKVVRITIETIKSDRWKEKDVVVKLTNNMGAVTEEEIEAFANLVLKEFPGWQMRWTKASPSICIRERKLIFIEERWINKYPWMAKENVLHEAAHINTPNDNFHGVEFYREYVRLLNQFMRGLK